VQVNFVVKELAGLENNFAGLAPRLFSPICLKIQTNEYRNVIAPHIVTRSKGSKEILELMNKAERV
jgi:hypothetical protein